jgi:hypothetical protein
MIQESQTIERITALEQKVVELREQVNRLARRKGRDPVSGDPVPPINDCSECGGSCHKTVDGVVVRCDCYKVFQGRLDAYNRSAALLARRRKRNRSRI